MYPLSVALSKYRRRLITNHSAPLGLTQQLPSLPFTHRSLFANCRAISRRKVTDAVVAVHSRGAGSADASIVRIEALYAVRW